jgi:hypothetical protein
MPRYFFHVRNSTGYMLDEEGEELADFEAARDAAVNAVRSIISEESKIGRIDLRGRIEVSEEEGGEVILTLPFSEALDIRTGPPPEGDTKPGVTR